MAAAPDDGTLRRPSAPLGAILVERGVLTQEQLAAALAEQERSGEQLGAIVVRLGFTVPPMIGQGLATQHGGLLKTEYGYAVGFGGGTTAPHADPPPVSPEPTEDEPSARLRLVSAARATPPDASAPISALAPAEALSAPPASAPDDDVLKWQQQAQELATQRDTALRDLQALAAERIASAAELEAATSRIAELEAVAAQDRRPTRRRLRAPATKRPHAQRSRTEARGAGGGGGARDRTRSRSGPRPGGDDEVGARPRGGGVTQFGARAEAPAELQAVAAARDRELAAARARLAELEAARAAGEDGSDAVSSNLEAEVARVQMEKANLMTANDALASPATRNSKTVWRRSKPRGAQVGSSQRVEASAKIRQLEAERDDALLARVFSGSNSVNMITTSTPRIPRTCSLPRFTRNTFCSSETADRPRPARRSSSKRRTARVRRLLVAKFRRRPLARYPPGMRVPDRTGVIPPPRPWRAQVRLLWSRATPGCAAARSGGCRGAANRSALIAREELSVLCERHCMRVRSGFRFGVYGLAGLGVAAVWVYAFQALLPAPKVLLPRVPGALSGSTEVIPAIRRAGHSSVTAKTVRQGSAAPSERAAVGLTTLPTGSTHGSAVSAKTSKPKRPRPGTPAPGGTTPPSKPGAATRRISGQRVLDLTDCLPRHGYRRLVGAPEHAGHHPEPHPARVRARRRHHVRSRPDRLCAGP